MMTKNIIAVAAAFMFALTVGILTAKIAESGNDRASSPPIRTFAGFSPRGRRWRPLSLTRGSDGNEDANAFHLRVDTWTPDGESVVEHVAGVEDYELALVPRR